MKQIKIFALLVVLIFSAGLCYSQDKYVPPTGPANLKISSCQPDPKLTIAAKDTKQTLFVHIRNEGLSASKSCKVAVFNPGARTPQLFDCRAIGARNPRFMSMIPTYTLKIEPKVDFSGPVIVIVDYTNTTRETNEKDNKATFTWTYNKSTRKLKLWNRSGCVVYFWIHNLDTGKKDSGKLGIWPLSRKHTVILKHLLESRVKLTVQKWGQKKHYICKDKIIKLYYNKVVQIYGKPLTRKHDKVVESGWL